MITSNITEDLLSNQNAAIVAVTTAATGIGQILDLIPNDVGKLATLLGAVLTTVIIYGKIIHMRIEYDKAELLNEKIKLENEILRSKLNGDNE